MCALLIAFIAPIPYESVSRRTKDVAVVGGRLSHVENEGRTMNRMSNANPYIVSEGDEALKERPKAAKVRFLKAGESFKGRLIAPSQIETGFNFIKFEQHGDFATKLVSHSCHDPKAKKERRASTCPSCLAGLKSKLKTLVFFWNADKGELVVKDIAEGNMDGVRTAKENYGDDLYAESFVIGIGDKGAVSISLLPPKQAKDVAPTPEGMLVNAETVNYALGVRTHDEVLAIIAGKTPGVENNAAGDGATIVRTDGAGTTGGSELF